MASSIMLRKGQPVDKKIIGDRVGYPCFVKPNNSGSSVGVTRVEDEGGLKNAIDIAFEEDREVLIESIMEGTEVACGIFKSGSGDIIFPVTELISKNKFFDYEAKYTPGLADEITPAGIETGVYNRVQELSSSIYDRLGCKGIVRIDFIIVDSNPMFLEINSIPGMTPESIIPGQIKAYGSTPAEIYSLVIEDLFQ